MFAASSRETIKGGSVERNSDSSIWTRVGFTPIFGGTRLNQLFSPVKHMNNPILYERAKRSVAHMKPSAYRSGMIVKKYKELGGTYSGPKPKRTGLARWFAENWKSNTGAYGYTSKSSVYRPTKRITAKTPTTFSELSRAQVLRAKREKARTGKVKVFNR